MRLDWETLILIHFYIFSMVAKASNFSLHWSGYITLLIFCTPRRTLNRYQFNFSLVEYFLPQSTMYFSISSQVQFYSRFPKHFISFFSLSVRSAYHSLQIERISFSKLSKRCLALQSSFISISEICLFSLTFFRFAISSFSLFYSFSIFCCILVNLSSLSFSCSFMRAWFLFYTLSNCSKHLPTEIQSFCLTYSTVIPPKASLNLSYNPSQEFLELGLIVALFVYCLPWDFSSSYLMYSFIAFSLHLYDSIQSVFVNIIFYSPAFYSLSRVNSIFFYSMISSDFLSTSFQIHFFTSSSPLAWRSCLCCRNLSMQCLLMSSILLERMITCMIF